MNRLLTIAIFTAAISSVQCSSLPNRSSLNDVAVQTAIKIAQPQIENLLNAELPILPSSRSRLPTINTLPGKIFEPDLKKQIRYDVTGNLILAPGDYAVPVLTYCMKSSGTSPDKHSYTLSRIMGTRASIIKALNTKALPRFLPQEIQILSWSLQNGLSYQEMATSSQKIVDEILPEFKNELQKSFLQSLSEKWDKISSDSHGVIPSWNNLSSDFLAQLGETGAIIRDLREFRQLVKTSGDDYNRLAELIQLPGQISKEPQETPWSKVSDQVYARFITKNHFLEIGQIQIRVQSQSSDRYPNEIKSKNISVDLMNLQADPGMSGIQPLSFSPLFGFSGVLIDSTLASDPRIAAALVAAILAAKIIDWNAVAQLLDTLGETTDKTLRKLLDHGNIVINKELDELEKPLRDIGIIDKDMKPDTEQNKSTRQYTKPGSSKKLEEDFKKILGDSTRSKDSKVEVKTLPNGDRAVKRPPEIQDPPKPTLELQSSKNGLKIKIRYF